MADEYKVSPTSRSSANVSERILSVSDSGVTRKVLRAEIHENPTNPRAMVSITIVHQRKGRKQPWEDIGGQPLSKLKAGEASKMQVDSAGTLALHEELCRLYEIPKGEGIPTRATELVFGRKDEIVRTGPRLAEAVRRLLDAGHPEEVWRVLAAKEPDLATRLSYAQIHEERAAALERFGALLRQDEPEAVWHAFLKDNTWIFGYGLDYRVLYRVQDKPVYGGASVDGRGGRIGDELRATAGDVRFTVLVEVKKPGTSLLGSQYRNGAYPPSSEVSGGVSQLQAQCRTWEVDGSRMEGNRERLGDVLTVSPKGILVVGLAAQLDGQEKRIAFELFRRNTVNPEILMFDELLARAEFIVDNERLPRAKETVSNVESGTTDPDDFWPDPTDEDAPIGLQSDIDLLRGR